MLKRGLLTLMSFLSFAYIIAQTNNEEPGNNIGLSLEVMMRDFPELRYIETDEKGDLYEDGYPQDGIAVFFYFQRNHVVEEFMIVQSNDGFPRMWFDSMAKALTSKYSEGFGISSYNEKHLCYSTFQVHLVYYSEESKNTALLIYKKGGYRNGVTAKTFHDEYGIN